jgi:uncharacterized protein
MPVEASKRYISSACRSSHNAFGASFFDQHLAVVVGYAGTLAQVLAADGEVVELAAWLHDIAAIRDVATVPQHHIAGAEIARTLLTEQGYPTERIESVAACIQCHSSPVQIGAGSPEAVCLSNADAMSQITRPAYWLYYAFAVRRFDFESGTQWYRQHVEDHWSQLIPPARDLIAESHERTQKILTTAAEP